MGWDFTRGATKQEIVNGLTNPTRSGLTVLTHKLKGNSLWVVYEDKDESPDKFIVLFLLESQGGWGYKGVPESHGPYYYDCPIEFLDMAPVANAEWREKVLKVSGVVREEAK